MFGRENRNKKLGSAPYKVRYSEVQEIAKQAMEKIRQVIIPGMSLFEVRRICETEMLRLGADSFWYWDIGALCFAGDETTISVSGRRYRTSDRIVLPDDIVTIDLSPQRKKIWGDYARTIVLEKGRVVTRIEEIVNKEWQAGLLMEEKLHQELKRFATPTTTFAELYEHINHYIVQSGFVNLDFKGNLGHSIAKSKKSRIYIEPSNRTRLSAAQLFTFEPHISTKESKFGYKKEDIYYFQDDMLNKL